MQTVSSIKNKKMMYEVCEFMWKRELLCKNVKIINTLYEHFAHNKTVEKWVIYVTIFAIRKTRKNEF